VSPLQPVIPPSIDGAKPSTRVIDGVGLVTMTKVEPVVLAADELRSLIRRRLPQAVEAKPVPA